MLSHQRLKVGDVVEYTGASKVFHVDKHFGSRGVIDSVLPDGNYIVYWTRTKARKYTYASNLQFISTGSSSGLTYEAPVSHPVELAPKVLGNATNLKVGDIVRSVEPWHTYGGELGRVTRISQGGYIDVQFEGIQAMLLEPQLFQIIKRIDEVKTPKQPKPKKLQVHKTANKAPQKHAFQVGDRVRYNDEKTSNMVFSKTRAGMLGTLQRFDSPDAGDGYGAYWQVAWESGVVAGAFEVNFRPVRTTNKAPQKHALRHHDLLNEVLKAERHAATCLKAVNIAEGTYGLAKRAAKDAREALDRAIEAEASRTFDAHA